MYVTVYISYTSKYKLNINEFLHLALLIVLNNLRKYPLSLSFKYQDFQTSSPKADENARKK